jgi:diamine N-acetyltransferase
MMGPPVFTDQTVPSWEDFRNDWEPHYFDDSAPERGRCFVILAGEEAVGMIAYGDIFETAAGRLTEIDIWLRSSADCGRGYGPEAIRLLCEYLERDLAVSQLVMQPSARNPRAIRAYEKVGFVRVSLPPQEAAIAYQTRPDYDDSVFLIKSLGA